MIARTLTIAALASGLFAQESTERRKVDDGWFDVSDFLKEKYGFLPIVMPITEPAIGYGAAGGLLFLSKPLGDAVAGRGRPSLTMLGGMATENGSQAGAIGDMRYWLEDRLQTRVFAVDGSINLEYHGVGEDTVLDRTPLHYNLDPAGVSLDARYRLGESNWWVGLGYNLAEVNVAFEDPSASGLPSFERRTAIGGLVPSVTYDSRDNMFTPTSGSYLETTAGLFDDSLGGDHDFQRVSLIGMHFMELSERWFLGVRADAAATFGTVPFYLQPYVPLRGVPMLRYQGETMASCEVELRWQFWQRFSVVGFSGVGAAWNDFEHYDNSSTAFSWGTGLRYELAREYGIHFGFDVAFGPEENVLYIQVGSAWTRP